MLLAIISTGRAPYWEGTDLGVPLNLLSTEVLGGHRHVGMHMPVVLEEMLIGDFWQF